MGGESSRAIPQTLECLHNVVLGDDPMADISASNLRLPFEIEPTKNADERRAQPRGETVFSRIEDATYAILREHEKKTA
jgi:hypothetical protein